MPSMFGKESKKKELVKKLNNVYLELQKEHQIPPGDFPDITLMQEKLLQQDFSKFNTIKPKLLEAVDMMLRDDISKIMAMIPREQELNAETAPVQGGALNALVDNPFGHGRGEGADAGSLQVDWVVEKDRFKFDAIFNRMNPVDGKISGAAAKSEMVKSKLPNTVLGKIWKLSDIDKDGQLDMDEFALAMHLINVKLEGHEIPTELPDHLIPPSKKH